MMTDAVDLSHRKSYWLVARPEPPAAPAEAIRAAQAKRAAHQAVTSQTHTRARTRDIVAAAAAMASRGGGDPRPEDDPFSDGDTTESDSGDESLPRRPRAGARRPGASTPILTRLAVSRNPSPLAAATAAPGVCLLRFAWESAAGSLVGAVVGYGKATPPANLYCSVIPIPCSSSAAR